MPLDCLEGLPQQRSKWWLII